LSPAEFSRLVPQNRGQDRRTGTAIPYTLGTSSGSRSSLGTEPIGTTLQVVGKGLTGYRKELE